MLLKVMDAILKVNEYGNTEKLSFEYVTGLDI